MSPAAPRFPTDTEIIDAFLERGIDTVCTVEDSAMATMDQYLCDLEAKGKVTRWVLPSERSIPAVATGRWLATGKLTLMSMQNTGLTNAMDYLRTLMTVHRIPGIVISGWRGHDPVLDHSEPHILIGDVTDADARNTFEASCIFGHRDGADLLNETKDAIDSALRGDLAILRVSPSGFAKTCTLQPLKDSAIPYSDPECYAECARRKGKPFREVQKEPLMTRDDALLHLHEMMKPLDPFYIVGNGFNPRAMQALRITERTFENSGAMGSSLGIAWGAAKSNPDQVFVAIDGDQNAIMNEMDKVIAHDYPGNLFWFILNNGTGESVAPTPSLPLSPWHYDLAHVINTTNGLVGSFDYPRLDDSGLKFDPQEAKTLAAKIGNLPAQAHLARRLLSRDNNKAR
jgi:phosphonopyruvate decarboxylase